MRAFTLFSAPTTLRLLYPYSPHGFRCYWVHVSVEAAEEDDAHDPSKLSLAERVKLFNQKMVTERLAPKPTGRANRFKTQPVTTEEVETAKKITPISRTASSILGLNTARFPFLARTRTALCWFSWLWLVVVC